MSPWSPSTRPQHLREQLRHQQVEPEEIEAEEEGRGDHHHGGRLDLRPRGPRHLLQLAPHLDEEGLQLAELPGQPSHGAGAPGRQAGARAFIVVHLSRLYDRHLLRPLTHPGALEWQARRDSNPQPPVLETGAPPLSYWPVSLSGGNTASCSPLGPP